MTGERNVESADRDRVAELQRWQDSGAYWQVVSRSGGGVTIALLRCDGGEEVDRFTSNDPRVLAFIGNRSDNPEPHTLRLGRLTFVPAATSPDLLGAPVRRYVEQHLPDELWVTEIDPSLADTAEFCAHYDVGLYTSANCVIVEAKRGGRVWYAACVVLATTRADVNGIVRKTLDARKVSFAAPEIAVSLTDMEYGGITPVGLPADWRVFVDEGVIAAGRVIIGSGIRGSKLLASTDLLQAVPNTEVLAITKAG